MIVILYSKIFELKRLFLILTVYGHLQQINLQQASLYGHPNLGNLQLMLQVALLQMVLAAYK